MSANGRNPVNLTAGSPASDGNASWRPDGRKIVFTSDRATPGNPTPPGSTGPDFEVFVMNADGSHPTQLTFNGLRRRRRALVAGRPARCSSSATSTPCAGRATTTCS